MYDKNGHLKQVIRCKCDSKNRIKIGLKLTQLNVKFTPYPSVIDCDDIMIVLSTFDGYELDDLLNLLDKRYSK